MLANEIANALRPVNGMLVTPEMVNQCLYGPALSKYVQQDHKYRWKLRSHTMSDHDEDDNIWSKTEVSAKEDIDLPTKITNLLKKADRPLFAVDIADRLTNECGILVTREMVNQCIYETALRESLQQDRNYRWLLRSQAMADHGENDNILDNGPEVSTREPAIPVPKTEELPLIFTRTHNEETTAASKGRKSGNMGTAKDILEFHFDFQSFSRFVSVRRPPAKIMGMLEDIRERHEKAGIPKPLELRQVYRDFILRSSSETSELLRFFNSTRLIRKLSWALTYSEKTAPFNQRITDTAILHKALALIEKRLSASAIAGVYDALLQAWTSSNSPSLRRFLKKHIANYTGHRKQLVNLREQQKYYCEENGPTQLAMTMLREHMPLSQVWSYLELPDYMHQYSYFGVIASAYTSLARRAGFDRNVLDDIVGFLGIHNSDATDKNVISALIEYLGDEASENLRQPIQSYALKKWGDPRITGGQIRWRGVSDIARKIFTRWLTTEDLVFFFDVVSRACRDKQFEYRRAFWLAYLEHISFCRPVLRSEARQYFANDPQAQQYFYQRQPANLRGGTRDQHAFIIQIANYTFVEFSTAGACYVYSNSSLPFDTSKMSYHISRLRNQSWAVERFIHDSYFRWQNRLQSWIKDEIGIYPIRSYRVR